MAELDIDKVFNAEFDRAVKSLDDTVEWIDWSGSSNEGHTVSQLLIQIYNDRLGFELLQNAQDSLRKNGSIGGKGSMYVKFRPGRILVGDSGLGFNQESITSFKYAGNSTNDPGLVTIGHKGLGLRSMLQFSKNPRFYQPQASWEFSEEIIRSRLQWAIEEVVRNGGAGRTLPDRLPFLRFPLRIEPSNFDADDESARQLIDTKECGFVLSLDVDEDQRESLRYILRSALVGSNILFLRNLHQVTLDEHDIGGGVTVFSVSTVGWA
jgi:hypothetical protein